MRSQFEVTYELAMTSYQNSDIESEEASLLSVNLSDETTVAPTNSKRSYIVVASIMAMLITFASIMRNETIQMKFASLWTKSTPSQDAGHLTVHLDRHHVECEKNAGLIGYKLGSSPGYKIRENYGN
jgi:hypothetical protein